MNIIKKILQAYTKRQGKASLLADGQMERFNIAFTALLGSSTKAKDLMSDAIAFTEKTHFHLRDVLNAIKLLLIYQGDRENIMPILRNLGDVAVELGEDIIIIASAYCDIKSRGKLEEGQRVLEYEIKKKFKIGKKNDSEELR